MDGLGFSVQPCSSPPLPAGAGTSCAWALGNSRCGEAGASVNPPSIPQRLLPGLPRGLEGARPGACIHHGYILTLQAAKCSSETLEQESGRHLGILY